MLHFDTREFLNVLALAFEEPEFTSELGLRQVQRLVDILLLVMVQQGDGFTVSTIHCVVATLVQAWRVHEFVDVLLWTVFSRQHFGQYHTLCCWHGSLGMACAMACFCFLYHIICRIYTVLYCPSPLLIITSVNMWYKSIRISKYLLITLFMPNINMNFVVSSLKAYLTITCTTV